MTNWEEKGGERNREGRLKKEKDEAERKWKEDRKIEDRKEKDTERKREE